MTFFRFTLTIFFISILALGSNIHFITSETGNRKLVQTDFKNAYSFSAPPNDDSFGISIKIPGVEGVFAVVATDDIGGVYVAYQSHWEEIDNSSPSYHVYFAYSHDFGESWSKSFKVDDSIGSSIWCDSPSIAIDQSNGHIFVAWKDNRSGVAKVYIDKSVDRGVSFGSDLLVYNWPNDYFPPWLPYTVNLGVSDDGKIYLTWIAYSSGSYIDSNILFTYSIDGGQTFHSPIIISSIEGEAILAHPWIAIDSNNVLYVTYSRRNSTSAGVYIVKSQNGGSSFEPPVTVTDSSTQKYCGGAKVAVSSDGKIHVVWTDNRAGDGIQYLDIYFATSLDGGLTFGSNICINDDLVVTPRSPESQFTRGPQGTPTIAIDSNSMVHIFWEDFRNYVDDTTYCRDIYYASSKNGTQFSENLKVNYVHPDVDSVNCADPNIVIDSQDNFYLVYSDTPSGDNDYHYIYFMYIPQPSKTSSSIFGFQLIPLLTVFLIAIFFTQKKQNFRSNFLKSLMDHLENLMKTVNKWWKPSEP
ncbi:MAG: sialidase family protein [Candidatus Hodarchaeota archaeon]